jgi:hypothetical protein
MQQELESMRKALEIHNYATMTVDTYVSVLKRFLQQLDTHQGNTNIRATRDRTCSWFR